MYPGQACVWKRAGHENTGKNAKEGEDDSPSFLLAAYGQHFFMSWSLISQAPNQALFFYINTYNSTIDN